MTAEELKRALAEYQSAYDDIGITLYALLKDTETLEPVKLDIEAAALGGLKDLFMQSLGEIIFDNEELSVVNLSSSDERLDAIYCYDLEVPPELSVMEAVVTQDGLPSLNLNDKSLSSIRALLVEIGNDVGQIVLYKAMAPVNIFGRTGFFLKKSASRLEQLSDEFLRVSAGFQMFRINGTLMVVDLASLERSFGFHDVIKREAAAGLAAIEDRELISNPDVLRELVDDVKYARKLTKVAKSSPVLKAGVSNTNIIRFCQTFPNLVGKIRFNEAQDKIELDTNVSKDLFIKLLMDDFLTSELTSFHYTSLAKDSVENVTPVQDE